MTYPTLLLNAILLAVALGLIRYQIQQRRRPPLPPGPKGYPLIGNILDMPKEFEHITFTEWYEKYGDIVHVNVLGKSLVILNTRETTLDLLEGRSSNYSNRPGGTMLLDLLGCRWMFTFMNYEDTGWKIRRKVFQSTFHQQAVKTFAPIQEQKTLLFLNRLLTLSDPEAELGRATHYFISSIILAVVYGYDIKGDHDELEALCYSVNVRVIEVINQTFLVDLIPILKYIPSWFPFAKFKRVAEELRPKIMEMRDKPFEYTGVSGTSERCMVSQRLSRLDATSPEDPAKELQTIKDVASIAYLGGLDTTTGSILLFCRAMTLYPEVQKRAQAEIDSVLGKPGARLPTLEDKENLPYIQAIVSEVLRWHPLAPLAIPHQTVNDDVYKGYFIPAGSIVFGNTWAILRDPTEYPDPYTFNPDRFLPQGDKPMPMDPATAAFGYGRRTCPAQYLALETMWIAFASLLATFDILPGPGEETKKPSLTSVDHIPGAVAAPKDFPCRFVPRSPEVVKLIAEANKGI